MRLFIDIDKTIATDPDGMNMACYLSRQLGIVSAPGETLKDYLARTEVKAWAETNQEHFKAIWKAAQDDPDIHWRAVPAPGSRVLLRLLSLVGDISYFTCRLPQAREVTQTWLEKFQYPSSSYVSYCEHALSKVEMAVTSTTGSTHPVVLVDDHAPDLLKAVRHLARSGHPSFSRIREHFLLVQFGSSEILEHPQGIVRVAALPHWGLVPFVRAISRLRTDVVDVERMLGSLEPLPKRMQVLQQNITAAAQSEGGPHELSRLTHNEPL